MRPLWHNMGMSFAYRKKSASMKSQPEYNN